MSNALCVAMEGGHGICNLLKVPPPPATWQNGWMGKDRQASHNIPECKGLELVAKIILQMQVSSAPSKRIQ